MMLRTGDSLQRFAWLQLVPVICMAVSSLQAQAQNTIYRCGNEYTNQARMAKEQGCKPVEGGAVTVVRSADTAVRSGSSKPPTLSQPASTVRADAQEQQRRDSDAKAILKAELEKAQGQLNALKAEYNEGNPDRTALELRNPQHYQNRLEQLKASIERQESDVAGIERELSRLP